MLDDLESLKSRDRSGFLARLHALPERLDVPDGPLPAPVRLHATPAAGALAAVLAPWLAAPGAASVAVALPWGSGAVGLTDGAHAILALGRPSDGDEAEVHDPRVVALGDEAFAPYSVARYLAFATGRPEAGERLAAVLRSIAAAAHPAAPSETNPAKRLAWALWQRVPLLIGDVAVQHLVQQVFALVGKAFAVPAGVAPTLLAATAFEGRHALADDLVALLLEPGDATLHEVLATRVAQVEALHHGTPWFPESTGDAVIDALALWYAATWVAAYGALLADLDPGSAGVYDRVVALA
jgi:hypothetical protein